MFDYNNKKFKSLSNSGTGEVDAQTIFHYRQKGSEIWATYSGGSISTGTLVAKVNEKGALDMRYQHLNIEGAFKTGKCISTPERLENGKIRLYESWQWTCDDFSSGESIIEEI